MEPEYDLDEYDDYCLLGNRRITGKESNEFVRSWCVDNYLTVIKITANIMRKERYTVEPLEDVVQSVLVKVFSASLTFDRDVKQNDTKMRHLISFTANNLVRDQLRKIRTRNKYLGNTANSEHFVSVVIPSSISPFAPVNEKSIDMQRAVRALSKLPSVYSDILEMLSDGFSQTQICSKLGISVRQLKNSMKICDNVAREYIDG